MAAGPDFASAIINIRKLTHYLLADDHPEGAAKAAFFRMCGFSPETTGALAHALRLQAASAPPTSIRTEFGIKYVVDGPLAGLDGSARRVRSIWIVDTEASPVRFVTAYPLEPRRAGL